MEQLSNQIKILSEKLAKLEDSVSKKKAARNEYDKTIKETEAAYVKVTVCYSELIIRFWNQVKHCYKYSKEKQETLLKSELLMYHNCISSVIWRMYFTCHLSYNIYFALHSNAYAISYHFDNSFILLFSIVFSQLFPSKFAIVKLFTVSESMHLGLTPYPSGLERGL